MKKQNKPQNKKEKNTNSVQPPTSHQAKYEREVLYPLIFENATDAILTINEDDVIVSANASTKNIFGYSPNEIIGRRLTSFIPERLRQSHEVSFRDYLINGKKHSRWEGIERPCLHKNGKEILVEISYAEYQQEGKRFFTGIIREITERKQTEARLLRLFNAVQTSTESIVITDTNSIIMEVNDATLRLYQAVTRDDLIGKNAIELFAPEVRAKALSDLSRVIEAGKITNEEYLLIRKDGTRIPIEVNAALIRDENGNPAGLVAISRDLTERKHIERSLKESESKYRTLMEQASDGIFIADTTGKYTDVNSRGCEMLGYSRDEILNLSIPDLIVKEDVMKDPVRFDELLVGKTLLKERRMIRKDGTILQTEISAKMLLDGRFQGIVRDITERKRVEDALREKEKHSQSLLRLSKKLELAHTYGEALYAALAEMESTLGYKTLWVYLLSEDKKYFKALTAGGPISPTVLSEEGTATLTIQGDRMLEEIAAAKDIVVVTDAVNDERTNKEIVKRINIHTIINVPIFLLDKRLGAIGTGTFGEEGIRVPTKLELEYFSALASHMAVTFDRVRLLVEQTQAEEHLRVSESRFRALVEQSPFSMVIYRPDGRPFMANQAFADLWGVSTEGIKHLQQHYNILHDEQLRANGLMPYIERGFAGEIITVPAIRYDMRQTEITRPVSTKSLWVQGFLYPIKDQNGSLSEVVLMHEDITEGKEAEQTVQRQLVFAQALNRISEIIIEQENPEVIIQSTTNIVGETLHVDRCLIYDISLKENLAIGLSEWLNPHVQGISQTKGTYNLETFRCGNREVLRTHSYLVSHNNNINKNFVEDGSATLLHEEMQIQSLLWYPFDFRQDNYGVLVFNQVTELRNWLPDEIEFIGAIAHQVTLALQKVRLLSERAQSVEALRVSETQLHALIDNIADVIIITDSKGVITFASPSVQQILGYTTEEVVGKNYMEWAHPEDIQIVKKAFDQRTSSKGRASEGTRARCRHKNGSWKILEGIGTNLLDDPVIEGFVINIRDVTSSQMAEELLREREERYRQLFENAPVGIYRTTPDGRILESNPALIRMLGYSSFDEFKARNLEQEPDSSYPRNAFKEQIEREGFIAGLEAEWKKQDGTPLFVRENAQAIRNESGAVIWYDGTVEDITERKKTVEALRESEERFRALSEASFEALFISEKGICLGQNQTAENLFGYTLEEAIGRYGTEWIVPEHRDIVMNNMLSGFEGPYEVTALRKDRTTFPCEIQGRMFDYKGRRVRITALRDITRQKQAQEELRKSELKYRTIFENVQDVFYQSDAKGNFTDVSPSIEKYSGYTREELIGKPVASYYDNPNEREHLLQEIQKRGEVTDFEVRMKTKNSRLVYVSVNAHVLLDEQGNFKGIEGSLRNITERKQAEKAFEKINRLQELILNSAGEGIMGMNLEGRHTFVNRQASLMLGYEPEELAGQHSHSTWHHIKPDGSRYPDDDCKIYESMRSGIIHTIADEVFWRKDGTSFPVEYTSTPIREGDTIVGVVVVFTDITQRKNLESQLRQAQKMESLGTLAGGIAHDFNNILGIIMGHASLMERDPGGEEQLMKRIQAINKASQRGASLVKQLLMFARKTETRFEPVQLNETVNEVRKLLGETFPKAIIITIETESSLPPIHADSSQLHQVLVNLCVNARDAMPAGGMLNLSTERIAGEILRQRIPKATVNDYVHLSVSDSGIGMDKDTQSRIFEPFFTTKEVGKGTGLGLASVYGIVENHHGFILVESEVGKGTMFHIYFPVYQTEPVEIEGKPRVVPVTELGTETILIADDEELLRTMLEQLLTGQGYTVISASDGAEALSLYARHQKNISLVISDVGMPKLSGIELVTALQAINPSVKVIISSGYLDTKLMEEIRRIGANEYIMKPFSLSEILTKMRLVLEMKK